MKINYSWGLKGHPLEIQNSSFTGSVSMIMAICSNWAWISFVIKETIDSTNFNWFLKIMVNWLISQNCFGYSQVMLLSDN